MFNFNLSSNQTTEIILAASGIIIAIGLFFYLTRQNKNSGELDAETTGNQVYIGNLSYRVRERHLREYFSDMGDIEHLRIIKDHGSGRSKGFGFITFKEAKGANKSLKLHGKDFEGRSLVVRIARPK